MTWDYTKEEYAQQTKADPAWHLERMLRYGTAGEKIDRAQLRTAWATLRMTDDQRAFFELLLWNKPF